MPAREQDTGTGGWVENRFRLVEERLCRLESGEETEWTQDEADAYAGALCVDGLTVGELRAKLAGFDPRAPVSFRLGDKELRLDTGSLWQEMTRRAAESTPLRSVFLHRVLIRLSED